MRRAGHDGQERTRLRTASISARTSVDRDFTREIEEDLLSE
jgi:hypothetical protein